MNNQFQTAVQARAQAMCHASYRNIQAMQSVIHQLLFLHGCNDAGMCKGCGITYPCPTTVIIAQGVAPEEYKARKV